MNPSNPGPFPGRGRIVLVLSCCLMILASVGLTRASTTLPGTPLDRITGDFTAAVVATDLASPDGLAFHPKDGTLYVAETGADRVVRLDEGTVSTVVSDGWNMSPELPNWALRMGRDRAFWLEPKLRGPQALAFSQDGRLFVAEAQPSGRLLEFAPDWRGKFTQAKVIPIPWMAKDFSWQGIRATEDGRLFIAGAATDAGPGLHFGTVLMRDSDLEWWVIDYGPFSGFSSVALSRGEDILVVSDAVAGGVTWWDTVRHKVIGTSDGAIPGAQGTCLLSDGSIVVSQKADSRFVVDLPGDTDQASGGRLVRVNPESQKDEILAAGFGAIESVIAAPETGYLYVTEASSGSVIELRPNRPFLAHDYLLRRSMYTFELAQGLSPKQWPSFMKDFVSKLGVRPTDEEAREDGQDTPQEDTTTFTVREFCERIPMIAGRVKVVNADMVETSSVDPVSQIDFVVFYPGQTVINGNNATPSLSLFSAQHKSGRTERTRAVEGYQSASYRYGGKWKKQSNNAQLFFPMATCTTRRQPQGVDVTLAFLGMGFSEDYYLELECGQVDRGKLVVDGKNGVLADYDVQFTERTLDGAEVRNIMIAGFDPQEGDDYSWLKIGKDPVDSQLNLDEQTSWISYRMAAFKPILEKKELEWRMVQWDDGLEERTVTAPSDMPTAEQPDRSGEQFEDQAVDPNAPIHTRRSGSDQHAATAPRDAENGDNVTQAVPDDEEEYPAQSWTNMILSRALKTWQTGSF